MPYDFRRLAPYDFERLIRDLLNADLHLRFQSFTPGVDRGIDLRHRNRDGTVYIVQCKHYASSTVPMLLRNLRSHEVPKVTQLRPARYGVATSLGLTEANKQEIVETFAPFVHDSPWVWGRDDIDAMLTRNYEVARRHFKLWLASTEMLDAVTNAEILNRTEGYLQRVADDAPLYGQTKAYHQARRRLTKHHVCILSGIPGIGKSSLANMLLLEYLRRGYHPVVISRDVKEAWQMLRSADAQFFLYDDFLGANTLERLAKNEDSRLLDFMRTVARADNKRLVMCTREYILREAQSVSELWRFADVNPIKYVLKLRDYTRFQRARVLYNHVYFSSLTPAARESLVRNYTAIVDHPNYNPRLVSHLVAMARGQGADNETFAEFAVSVLSV